MTYVRMADAAFAQNIPPGFAIAGGYYGGPQAYHVWPGHDWALFPGFRLPIWVAGDHGALEAADALEALHTLGVPRGCATVLDMETRHAAGDITYVEEFGTQLRAAGYKVWVYGSRSTVFANPPLNGYWVADYTSDMREIDGLLQAPHVRAVQFATAPGYDVSLVKAWTEGEMWHG